jgi:hypothetical protein
MNNIKFNEVENNKIIAIDFLSEKRKFVKLFLIFFIPLTIFILVSPTINYNGEIVDMSLLSRVGIMCYPLIIFTALYYLLFYPLYIKIIKRQEGSVSIEQRGSFFVKNNFFINNENKLFILAKKRRVFSKGLNVKIFVIPRYEIFFVHNSEGMSKEIPIFFRISYMSHGYGSNIGFFKKEEIEEISNKLNIPVTFD